MIETYDWFHAILEFLYKKPLNGRYHDLREIFGDGKPLYFDSVEGRNGYKRIRDVIAFLEEREFVKYEKTPIPGIEGFVLDLGEAPNFIDVANTITTQIEGNEKTLYWMTKLLPLGHEYYEKRLRDAEFHQSTLTTNQFIKRTYCLSIMALGVAVFNMILVHWDTIKQREGNSCVCKELTNADIVQDTIPVNQRH